MPEKISYPGSFSGTLYPQIVVETGWVEHLTSETSFASYLCPDFEGEFFSVAGV